MSPTNHPNERDTNPYASPSAAEPSWFVWRRVPSALRAAWGAYRDEMRQSGCTGIDHIVHLGCLLVWVAMIGVVMTAMSVTLFREFLGSAL